MNTDKIEGKLDKLLMQKLRGKFTEFDFDKWKQNHKKEIEIYQSQTAGRQIPNPAQPFNIFRIIMKSRISKLAAAAVIILCAGLGLYYFEGGWTGKVYAMSDAPQIFYSAKTVHIKGRMYFPEADEGRVQRFCETEYWVDPENGRLRLIAPSTYSGPEGFSVNIIENICNGDDYEISIDHTNKQVQFAKLSRFQKTLFNYQNIHTIMQFMFSTPEIFDEYEVVGSQIIGNRKYQIWQAVIAQADLMYSIKVHSWLCPQTGQLAKMIFWLSEKGGDWQKKMEIEEIELNNPIAAEVFQPQIPKDYTMKNTKESAEQKPMYTLYGSVKNYWLRIHLLFMLPDGSAILCFGSEGTSLSNSQKGLFEGLQTGESFPKLPFQVDALQTIYKKQTIRYQGHHLTYTTKDGKFYEWGLYVPSQVIEAEIAQLLSFQVIYSDNVNDPEVKGGFRLSLSPNIIIKNREEFNELVVGAMRELNDSEDIPDRFSYENITKLAERTRK